MLTSLFLAWSLVAQAQSWPNVTEGLPRSTEGRNDAAVIVGISDYFQIADVPGAVDNALDWRRYLESRGTALANIRLLANGEATREAMLEEAKWVSGRAKAGGKVWFVYIGHGAPAPDGKDGLLVGADAQGSARSLAARSARQGEVLDALTGGSAAETVVVLDACFSGKVGTSEMLAEGLQPVIPTYATASKTATVLSAGKSDQFAGPLPGLGRPAFSYLTLGALRGWGDRDGDGEVTASEAVAYANGALSVLVTDRRQEPEVSGKNTALVLGKGREEGPNLLGLAESLVDRGPVTAVVNAGDGSASVDVGRLEARIRERECQAAADAEALRLRDAALAREGGPVATRLEGEWASLKSTSERCAEVGDTALRKECRGAVSAFLAALGEQGTVRITAGEHEVTTACGAMRGLAPAVEVSVVASLREEVEAFAATYGEDGTRGTAHAAAPKGTDVTSPLLGSLKWIPAGTFVMGSPLSEKNRRDNEVQHEVTLNSGFWMMEREVTQGMWRQVMKSNPSKYSACGDMCPVERVSWTDAVDFAKRLSAQEGLSYRLPTEAEWEYAARGGGSTPFSGGSEATSVGWVWNNSGSGPTHPGCEKARNGYGLCDMTGNVWEWTGDWYGAYPTTATTATTDPMGPQSGSLRAHRGGGWTLPAQDARVATRAGLFPGSGNDDLGFRLVRTNP